MTDNDGTVKTSPENTLPAGLAVDTAVFEIAAVRAIASCAPSSLITARWERRQTGLWRYWKVTLGRAATAAERAWLTANGFSSPGAVWTRRDQPGGIPFSMVIAFLVERR